MTIGLVGFLLGWCGGWFLLTCRKPLYSIAMLLAFVLLMLAVTAKYFGY